MSAEGLAAAIQEIIEGEKQIIIKRLEAIDLKPKAGALYQSAKYLQGLEDMRKAVIKVVKQ